ncbi:MAG: hypothetical protein ACRD6N_20740 [Pyrinomonadaceae bacterium]
MPSTKRKLSALLLPPGFSEAFDSFVAEFRSEQSEQLAKAANQVLQKSPSFTRIVDRLNKEYLSALRLEKLGGVNQFDPDDDGVLTTGPFSGRRSLFFSTSTGNRFLTTGSYQTQTTAFPLSDFIFLRFPVGEVTSEKQRGEAIAPLVASIAHETVHAFNRVTAVSTSGSSLSRADRAAAFIDEEIRTREKEKAILKELLSLKAGVLEKLEKDTKSKGLREQIENHIGTMKLSRPEVERDFLSGTDLTYLETFVIEDLIKQSIRVEKLESQTIQNNIKSVDGLVFTAPIDMVLQSAHPEQHTEDPESPELKTVFFTQVAELLLVRRVIEAHWNESGTNNRELILQRHREAVFPREIQYTPLP